MKRTAGTLAKTLKSSPQGLPFEDILQVNVPKNFKIQLSHHVKNLVRLSKKSKLNGEFRVTVTQFLDCVNLYSSRLDPIVTAEYLIETGEELIQIKGMCQIAVEHCYLRAETLTNTKSSPSFERLSLLQRIKVGKFIGEFFDISEFDLGYKYSRGRVDALLKSIKEFAREHFEQGLYHYMSVLRRELIHFEWVFEVIRDNNSLDEKEISIICLAMLEILCLARDAKLLRAGCKNIGNVIDSVITKSPVPKANLIATKKLLQLIQISMVPEAKAPNESTRVNFTKDDQIRIPNLKNTNWCAEIRLIGSLKNSENEFKYHSNMFAYEFSYNTRYKDDFNALLQQSEHPAFIISPISNLLEIDNTEEGRVDFGLGKSKQFNHDGDEIKSRQQSPLEIKTYFTYLHAKEKIFAIVEAINNTQFSENSSKLEDKREDAGDTVAALLDMGESILLENVNLLKSIENSVMEFLYILFRQRRLKTLAKLFRYTEINQESQSNRINLSLLVAATKFQLSLINEKKVNFESNMEGKVTPTDFRVSKFDISETIAQYASVLCKQISNSLELLLDLPTVSQKITYDCTMLMWALLEPFFKDLKSPNEPSYFHNLEASSFFVSLVRFVESSLSNLITVLDYSQIIIYVGISTKISLMLEILDMYEVACTIMENTIANIQWIRLKRCGNSQSELVSLTADSGFLLNQNCPEHVPNPDLDFLTCVEMDTTNLLYRFCIKSLLRDEMVEEQRLADEELRFRHRVRQFPGKKYYLNPEIIAKLCGDCPVRQSLYFMSCIQLDTDMDPDTQQDLLKKISSLLNSAKTFEMRNLERIRDNFNPFQINRFFGHGLQIEFDKSLLSADEIKIFVERNCEYDSKEHEICWSGVPIKIIADKQAVVVSGLLKNKKYKIKTIAYRNSQKIFESEFSTIGGWRLSIPLAFAYLYHLSVNFELGGNEVQSHCRRVLDHYLVKTKLTAEELRMTNSEGFYNQRTYSINDQAINPTKSAIVNSIVHSLIQVIQYEKKLGRADSLMINLRNAQDLLIAYRLAKACEDAELQALCATVLLNEIFKYLAIYSIPQFFVHCLRIIHSALVDNSNIFKKEKLNLFQEYLVPTTYFLVKNLILLGEGAEASNVATVSIKVINSYAYTTDSKIQNSSATEMQLLGYTFKVGAGKGKKSSAYYLQDYGFHAVAAVLKSPLAGIVKSRNLFDIFEEQLELLLIKNKLALNSSSDSVKKLPSKKSLDSITSLKDIFLVYNSMGVETTLQELTKFKKTLRYIEILTELSGWCLEKENCETAIKLANEIEDHVDKRSQIVLNFDDILLEATLDKRETILKRRKRQIFSVDIQKLETFNLAKRADISHNDSPSFAKIKGRLEKSLGNKKAEKHAFKSVVKSKPSSPAKQPASSGGSSKNSSKEKSDESHGSSQEKNNSKSNNKKNPPRPASTDQTKDRAVRKRKINAKQLFYQGLSPAEKEKLEHSVKILDEKISKLWRKSRYQQRIRILTEFESPFRAKAHNIRARAYFLQLQRDVRTLITPFDQEWAELRISGIVGDIPALTETTSANVIETIQSQNAANIEMLQSFVQSIVLATRVNRYLQCIKYSQDLWNAIKYLKAAGKLDSDFWKLVLWKGIFVVGYCVIETLENLRIFEGDPGELFYRFRNQIPNTGNSLQEEEFFRNELICQWNDEGNNIQLHKIDVKFCLDLLIYIAELLYMSGKRYRCIDFIIKVQTLFPGCERFNSLKLKLKEDPEISEYMDFVNTSPTEFSALQLCRINISKAVRSQNHQISTGSQIFKDCILKYQNIIKLAPEKNHPYIFSEVGDFLMEAGNIEGAAVYWSRSIDSCFKVTKAVSKISTLIKISKDADLDLFECEKNIELLGGGYNSFLTAMNLAKLATTIYASNDDKSSELIWAAGNIIFSCLTSSEADMHSASKFLEKHQVFKDKFVINSVAAYDILKGLCKSIIQTDYLSLCFPILLFLETMARDIFYSLHEISEISLLRLKLMLKQENIAECVAILSKFARRSSVKRLDSDPTSDVQANLYQGLINSALLKNISNLVLNEKAKQLLAPILHQEFEWAKFNTILCCLNLISKTIDRELLSEEGIVEILTNSRQNLTKSILFCQQQIMKNNDLAGNEERSEDPLVKLNHTWLVNADLLAEFFSIDNNDLLCIKRCLEIAAHLRKLHSDCDQSLYIAMFKHDRMYQFRNISRLIKTCISSGLSEYAYRLCLQLLKDYSPKKQSLKYLQILMWTLESYNFTVSDYDPSLKKEYLERVIECLKESKISGFQAQYMELVSSIAEQLLFQKDKPKTLIDGFVSIYAATLDSYEKFNIQNNIGNSIFVESCKLLVLKMCCSDDEKLGQRALTLFSEISNIKPISCLLEPIFGVFRMMVKENSAHKNVLLKILDMHVSQTNFLSYRRLEFFNSTLIPYMESDKVTKMVYQNVWIYRNRNLMLENDFIKIVVSTLPSILVAFIGISQKKHRFSFDSLGYDETSVLENHAVNIKDQVISLGELYNIRDGLERELFDYKFQSSLRRRSKVQLLIQAIDTYLQLKVKEYVPIDPQLELLGKDGPCIVTTWITIGVDKYIVFAGTKGHIQIQLEPFVLKQVGMLCVSVMSNLSYHIATEDLEFRLKAESEWKKLFDILKKYFKNETIPELTPRNCDILLYIFNTRNSFGSGWNLPIVISHNASELFRFPKANDLKADLDFISWFVKIKKY